MAAATETMIAPPELSDIREQYEAGALEKTERRLPAKLSAALCTLLEALNYGEDLGRCPWDFAVEITSLRPIGLSNSDFRWLVGRGLVDHAIEVTLSGDVERGFRQPPRLVLSRKTCFILTPQGADFARRLAGQGPMATAIELTLPLADERIEKLAIAATPPLAPKWDRDRQELRVGSAVVKRFKVPAANQEVVLAAFEEDGWPPRIDDPLAPHREQPPKRRLQETIKSLNRNQRRGLIRFLGDGSGQGVRWEFCGLAAGIRP